MATTPMERLPNSRVIVGKERKARGIRRFVPETEQRLRETGLWIYPIESKSILQLQFDERYPLHFHSHSPGGFLTKVPQHRQLAFNPNSFIIEESAECAFFHQQRLVAERASALGIPGAQGVIVEISALCQLLIKHYDRTGQKLTEDDFSIRSSTRLGTVPFGLDQLLQFANVRWGHDWGNDNLCIESRSLLKGYPKVAAGLILAPQ